MNHTSEGEAQPEVPRCDKKLDNESKASLKAALGSMLLVVGLGGAECAFATSTLPTTVVTATPSRDPIHTPINPCPQAVKAGGAHPNCSSGPGPGGGGGGSAPPPPPTPTLAEVKVTALAMKNTICGKNPDNTETLIFAYVNSAGAVVQSNAIRGTGQATLNYNSLGIPINATVTMEHNHPKNVYTMNPQEWVPSKADWESYSGLSNGGAPMQGQFIMGPDHILRYFDGSNRNYPAAYGYSGSGGPLPTGVVVSGGGC